MTGRLPDARSAALTDLADAVNELTRPRRHVEYLIERYAVQRPGRRVKSRQRRRAVATDLPPLLTALHAAAVPGSAATSDGTIAGPGGFESRPAAALGPLHALRTITAEAGRWRRELGLPGRPLPELLSSFVSHPHEDVNRLRRLADAAARWVGVARVAAGLEEEPWTMSKPCPECGRRRTLTMSADRTLVRCSHCRVKWSSAQFGVLAALIKHRTEEAAAGPAAPRCVWPSCPRRGAHDVHEDGAGRLFRDRCDVRVDVRSA